MMSRRIAVLFCVVMTMVFIGLGIWQVQRRNWKLALIQAVDQRAHAMAQPAPAAEAWAALTKPHDRYRHVQVAGFFLPGPDIRVQAVTALGGGQWLLSPFRDRRGFTVLINRGFAPFGQATDAPPSGSVTIAGLLRFSEPQGGFLHANNPDQDRWYSRDVSAIAQARHLENTAPYFIDEDAQGVLWPRAGLTVIVFANNHLIYAFTWFSLAALSATGCWLSATGRIR